MTGHSMRNIPSWVDLATPDVATAARFYTQLLGWRVEATTTPMGDYLVARTGDREVGGMMAVADVPAGWTLFFDVDDVDDAAARASEAGGRVLEAPFDLPDGRAAVLADPTGAMFGVLSGIPQHEPWMSRERGAVRWTELLSRDPAAAEAFYAVLFGWKATTDLGGVAYTTFALDDEPVAGMMLMPDTVPVGAPSQWSVYFAVDDCAEAAATTVRLGGRVLLEPKRVGAETFAVLADPTGATCNVMADA